MRDRKPRPRSGSRGIDVINIPYPSTHDYSNVLNYIPMVLVDAYSQAHVAGSQIYQTITVLDVLNMTQPSNNQLLGSRRFPTWFTLNTHTSKAIPRARLLLGHPWWIQQGDRPQKPDRRQ